MTTIDGGVVALGAGFAVTAAGALWKAATLRADVVTQYRDRVDLAQAALDERAAESLRNMAQHINAVLGDMERFDPHRAVGDPSRLLGYVKDVDKVLSARRRLPKYLKGLLSIGPMLTVLCGGLVVADLVALSYFSGWSRARGVGFGGMWAGLALLALSAAVVMRYVYLMHRFSGAEVLAMRSLDDE